jgi:hypothetical protein
VPYLVSVMLGGLCHAPRHWAVPDARRQVSSLKLTGYSWSYLACRVGHLAPIWHARAVLPMPWITTSELCESRKPHGVPREPGL